VGIHSQLNHKSDVVNILYKTGIAIESRVCIGDGALDEVDRIFAQMDSGKAEAASSLLTGAASSPAVRHEASAGKHVLKILVVCQPSVRTDYAEPALAKLQAAGHQSQLLELPDGEACKSHDQLLKVWSVLQEMQMQRSDFLVGIGGGALTDLAGFAASTYLRGIKLILIPTTLLGQVDAAIGGKTGINLPAGKNLAGSFYFPSVVIVDPGVLSTLSPRDFRSGLGEIIKYALIEDAVSEKTEYRRGPRSLWSLLRDADGQIEGDVLLGIINSCIRMKLAVVAKDPHEAGLRRCLNLGHTLAHAIEKVSQFKYSHGEAVAIGCVFACRLAERMGRLPAGQTEELVQVLKKIELPVAVPEELSKEQLTQAMAFDKKRQGAAIKWVLPVEKLGAVDLEVSMSAQEVRDLI
jgi:3-dehydroquinate synthase